MLWFVSDTHFGHNNIIEHCSRPYETVEDMDAALIRNWNYVVAKNDVVYHLGDFAWQGNRLTDYLSRLNGVIHLVKGNHDKANKCRQAGFASVELCAYLRHDGHRFWLSHYAHRAWYGRERGVMHLYGHWHGRGNEWSRSMDVGVDTPIGYMRPLHYTEVVQELSQRPTWNSNQEDTLIREGGRYL